MTFCSAVLFIGTNYETHANLKDLDTPTANHYVILAKVVGTHGTKCQKLREIRDRSTHTHGSNEQLTFRKILTLHNTNNLLIAQTDSPELVPSIESRDFNSFLTPIRVSEVELLCKHFKCNTEKATIEEALEMFSTKD